MKHKKLFAILTLVCFMFTLMPVAAMAEGEETVATELPPVADGVITLEKNVTLSETWEISDDVTVNGNGYSIISDADRIVRITTDNVSVTMSNVNFVSTAFRESTNDIRGISIDAGKKDINLTLINCSIVFDPESGNDWAYGVNICGGTNNINLNITDGAYEGANVINVWGSNHTVNITNATLTSLYAYNPLYVGVCVMLDKDDSNPSTDNAVSLNGVTFNGAYAIATENKGQNNTVTIGDDCVDNTVSCTLTNDIINNNIIDGVYTLPAPEDPNNAVIALGENINTSATLKIATPITLDLNNKTVTSSANKTFEVHASATFQNGTIINTASKGRCVDTRIDVDLSLNNVTLQTTGSGNTQPLTIGGSEAGTKVTVNNSVIAAGNSGYGIIDFVPATITVVDTDISGYAALYFKEGSKGSVATVDAASKMNAAGHVNESFGAITFEDTGINVSVDGPINMATVEGAANTAVCFNENANTVELNGAINGTILGEYTTASAITSNNSSVATQLEKEGYCVKEESGVYTVNDFGHKLVAVAEKAATYSAPGMLAHNKCEVCGKLYVGDTEKTAAELAIPQLEIPYVPPVSGGGSSTSTSTPKVETETTVTPSGTKVETTTETKSDGTKVETTTTTTASGETTKVETTTETNKEGTKVETTVTTDSKGETSTTVTATLDNGSAVTNNDKAVEVEVTKVEEKVVETVQEAVKADETVNVVGDADNAVSVSATNASTGAAQTDFVQPMSVNVPVDNTVLNNVEDTSKLTLAKVVTNEDGTTELVYMGGSYDEETGTFNAKVDEDGDYILVEKADLVKIELTIDDTTVKHNDKHQELDVAPAINAEAGRTELPLRYLGEALGFGIDWNNNVVTITKDGVSFSLTIGQEIPGYGTPYIDSDRTMVSARYISEMLGANVIWDPVDRQVIVVK